MNSSLRAFAFVTLVFLAAPFAASPAMAQSLPAGVSRVQSVEGINEYRLSNGLQVLLIPDDSKPTTTVNLTYHVGSRHENYGETGMAHLLEHLMFKGSPKHPKVWAKRLAVADMPYRHHVHPYVNELVQPWLVGYRRPLFWSNWWEQVDIDTALRLNRNTVQVRSTGLG